MAAPGRVLSTVLGTEHSAGYRAGSEQRFSHGLLRPCQEASLPCPPSSMLTVPPSPTPSPLPSTGLTLFQVEAPNLPLMEVAPPLFQRALPCVEPSLPPHQPFTADHGLKAHPLAVGIFLFLLVEAVQKNAVMPPAQAQTSADPHPPGSPCSELGVI